MFLKRLNTVGFKSFAERVNVDFVPGVTSVVGPNGSGKSNITDAIRWVLGEQSARSLRGTKMEDIIFSGSDSRHAQNKAEVTLTLDNHDHTLDLDFEEVSVTRRVFRSGESEFFINNQACRLKDIVDLFMDSGLGREAFSIISQGKVEEILSSKPEDRRSIFEEAAGVLKYKQRKKKAEYKLSETQENLNRVEDIIHEIDGQLEPLKEQASIARDYLDKKEELKLVEVSLLVAQIESLHEEWQTMLNDLDQVKQNEQALRADIEQKETALEKEREQLTDIDSRIESLQEKLLAQTQELENLEGKRELVKEKQKHYEENRAKLETEYEELQQKRDDLQKNVESETKVLEDLTRSKSDLNHALQETERSLEYGNRDIESEIEELKGEYIDLLNEQAAKRNEKQTTESQLAQLSSKKDSQQDKFKELRSEREQLQEQVAEHQNRLNTLSKERQETEKQLSQTQQKLKSDESQYEELQTKLHQGYQYLEKLKSKKEMLEEMKEDFQGYFQGVKEVLKARDAGTLQKIEGAVLEVLDIPTDYLTAIETALGAQAQHVIVEDDQAARQAIKWLKQQNKGRATFLPLPSIQPRFIPHHLKQEASRHEGWKGTAAELVHYEGKYERVVEHLLGHVVIAESLSHANELATTLQRKFRIVTLEGDVVNPGGSMSGGAKKQSNQSLFTREKELQSITEKLTSFEQKTLSVEAQVKHLKESIAADRQHLDEKQQEVNEQKEEENAQTSEINALQSKFEQVNNQLQLYDQDQEQYEQDRHRFKQQLTNVNNDLESLSTKLNTIQTEIDDLTQAKDEQQENKDNLRDQRNNLQIQLAEQESQAKNQREKTERYQNELQQVERELKENRHAYQQLMDIVNNKKTEEEISQEITTVKEQKTDSNKSLQEHRQQRTSHSHAIHDQEQALKEAKRIQQNYQQDIQSKEVKTNRMDVELENLLDYLQKEYMTTFERAKQDYPPVEDINEAQTRVKLIKRAIDELGSVNLGSIEEYDRIKERYEFLTSQQSDLQEAKSTLFNVISEMDREMHRLFEDTFTRIREEFQGVFRELFGGGRADLELTQPELLLETGVEIVAQPPGKKLQNLGLLSGGERALTAIALLFAILRVRPVPFCVLDEVEAALDEANVDRFAKYLKMFSQDTQFIVITHRKGTMEESDVLYGVTMQESGVSQLVSVKLEETPELMKA
ncbi:chromosome segregation protein SMC [Thalassobacillus sp. CUG 92003]|uniref:chromosome segregation protein SMC n=1 Tax=Thalassobacillus sp. CUG 92003 TaxID=2736641 RepID=UPI0015E6483B|nr:chromosome segregation protein SMC [Thalassobacillus sp. CUG 92003]